MNTPIPDHDLLFEAYHHVRAQLYRQIIKETLTGLAREVWVLDAGCGDTFYSGLLAEVLGPDTRIVAVDHNPTLLRSRLAPDGPAAIYRCLTDLERAGLRPGAFDAIWLCRTMHSALDPLRRLAALTPLLRSGGKLVVVENDFDHHPILPCPADFGHRILDAHRQYLKSRCTDGASLERYHAAGHLPLWLEQAGLRSVSSHTYISEDDAPMADDVEAYWRLFMGWLGRRIWPFLTPDEQQTYAEAFDPASPAYLLRHPGFYCLELTTVVCGFAPG